MPETSKNSYYENEKIEKEIRKPSAGRRVGVTYSVGGLGFSRDDPDYFVDSERNG